VNGESSDTARIAYARNIRKLAARVALAVLVSAGYFIYLLGLRAHPHRVGLACVIASAYIVLFAVVYSVVYRTQIAAARRM